MKHGCHNSPFFFCFNLNCRIIKSPERDNKNCAWHLCVLLAAWKNSFSADILKEFSKKVNWLDYKKKIQFQLKGQK